MAYATTQDVLARTTRTYTTDELSVIATYLDDAAVLIDNYNPNATTVINNNYGVGEEGTKPKAKKTMKDMLDQDLIDRAPIVKEIMNYVSCIRSFVCDEWKDRFMQLWEDILNLPEVADLVCDPGKQQGTNFNRSMVGNIIFYLVTKGFFGVEKDYNSSQFAVALEGTFEHSVRAELRILPAANIISRLDRVLENRELTQKAL